MITINNEQSDITIDIEQLKRDTQRVLTALEYDDFDIGILLATNQKMHEYNKQHRQQDKPTDILSFPYHSELKAGERIVAQTDDDKNLGDIIIAPQYVKDDLPRWNMGFEQRIRVLLVHGICHLLGYDHIEDEDYAVMHAQEKKLLKLLAQHDS